VNVKNNRKLNIKWSARDGIVSIISLAVLLTVVYFGSSKLFQALSEEQLLNISNIDNLSFSVLYGIQVFSMLAVVWFFAIFWRGASFKDLGLRHYSIIKTIWYTFISLLAIFFISFLYVYIMNQLFNIEAPASKIEELIIVRKFILEDFYIQHLKKAGESVLHYFCLLFCLRLLILKCIVLFH
jgi:magnesium-transporting ATPase (P-type)